MLNALGIAFVMNKEIKPTALTSVSAEHVKKNPFLHNTCAGKISFPTITAALLLRVL